jgi:hypothetical protein
MTPDEEFVGESPATSMNSSEESELKSADCFGTSAPHSGGSMNVLTAAQVPIHLVRFELKLQRGSSQPWLISSNSSCSERGVPC